MRQTLRNTAIAVAVFGGLFVAGQQLIRPGFAHLGWIDRPGTGAAPAAPFTSPAGVTPTVQSAAVPASARLAERALAAEVVRQASHRVRPAPVALAAPARLVDTPIAGAAPAAPAPRTLLLIDGVTAPVSAAQPVALPDGSRFRLQLRSAEPTRVEVHTLAPDGRASAGPLWQGTLAAGGAVETPRLRLTGLTGMETLRVLRRSLRDGSVSEERVRLLHE